MSLRSKNLRKRWKEIFENSQREWEREWAERGKAREKGGIT